MAFPESRVEHLPLQVAQFHDVPVHYAQPAHSGSCQVQGGGRAQPSCSHDEDGGVLESLLSGRAHLRQDDLAMVAERLLRSQTRHASSSSDRHQPPATEGTMDSTESRLTVRSAASRCRRSAPFRNRLI